MQQLPVGHRIGNVIKRVIAPLTWLYSWWFTFRSKNAVHFVMPDGFAVFFLLIAPSFVFPQFYFEHPLIFIGAIVLSPLALLSLLRIKDGKVIHLRLVLGVPYWVTRAPESSQFDLYEAWEDDRPSGVSFSLPPKNDKYLHLGSANTAYPLFTAIGAELKLQGWHADARNIGALTKPSFNATVQMQ